ARRPPDAPQPIYVGEQALGMVEHRSEVLQKGLVSAVLRLFEEQLAITLDGIQRGSQLMTQLAAMRLSGETIRPIDRRAVADPLDQRQELGRRGAHLVEIGNEIVEAVAPRDLKENVDKADN